MNWLDPLRRTLHETENPVSFFFRDDDVGWDDAQLFKFLQIFEEHDVPIDLAAIPKALESQTATRLRRLIENNGHRVAVHQHGYAHLNHEANQQQSEFGQSRSWGEQLADVRAGKELLTDLLGPISDAIFTPPWNRCTHITAVCLWELGFSCVSRDKTAPHLDAPGLTDLPICIDWFGQRQGVRLTPEETGRAIAAAAGDPRAVGIMFHHALMADDEQARMRELLQLISAHSQARCVLMRDVIKELQKA